ncbi:nucleoside/nucleotide kinase family protein [Mesorhizobium sp. INR15]|uniref:nucleoside/nucleotide kinase family protein n=1 Tax=Mesorhizobium sp. INR15 TaxID=2654248 RepID=UPI00189679F8|nr:nucleoside/nucleotide kinase family protein [Mesorhizobium sp. INR15]QPC95462.1 nucleoside/nucleotide kinase family protein [Mesorhizobium sp. INR15]
MEVLTFEQLVDVVFRRGANGRSITAIAGPPGSGKSTTAEKLERALNTLELGSAAVLPMDGYHLDDMVLEARGLLRRKGAPETFDVDGLGSMLMRLRANEVQEIAIPVFDRDTEIARAGARIIPQEVRRLIVEGNYLLLDQAPWHRLRSMFDTTVAIGVDESELRRRIEARWHGYGLSEAEVADKVDGNDLVNARLVLAGSVAAELML